MSGTKRKVFGAEFKAKVGLEAIHGVKTINQMELMIGLTEYFVFYNDERPHQSLGNRTPAAVYATGINGGARIVDKFSKNGAAPGSCMKDGQNSLN